MKITSKGQVTIPQVVRERAGMHPSSEVDFEVRDNGEVPIRLVAPTVASVRSVFERARGSANASQFKGMGMGTDEFLAHLRGRVPCQSRCRRCTNPVPVTAAVPRLSYGDTP